MKEKWIIVSNRLPIQYDSVKKVIKTSSGGLITAIQGIKTDQKKLWVGASLKQNPIPVKMLNKQNALDSLHDFRFVPVEIDRELYRSYYNGACNNVLWPLFHYESRLVDYKEEEWLAYKKVNKKFAEVIAKMAGPNDLVWIHDFHLFLLPYYLKKFNKNLRVGHFLHIPFPSSEIYRELPVRKEILESLLCADLVGFHDYTYLRHFSYSLETILGISSSLLTIEHNDRKTHMGVYPVSIDTSAFLEKAKSKLTKDQIKLLKKSKGRLMILGVDRLDYIKGIDLKLKAFRDLLESYPELQGKVELLQVAVPSRIDVPEYTELKEKIECLVGEINGRFSTPTYSPIKYIFNSIDVYQLMALYQSADVLFISSKRDGMNLVCLEYITVQNAKNPGVVVLSEFAGAISSLGDVLPINPWNRPDTVKTLFRALNMPLEERIQRHRSMLEFLKSYTATQWAESFMGQLSKQLPSGKTQKVISLEKLGSRPTLLNKLKKKKIILMVDYDGTLAPIVKNPADAMMSQKVAKIIKKINQSKNIILVIISGRTKSFLQKQFKDMDVYMASEHGASFYNKNTKKWKKLVNSDPQTWYTEALKMMRDYQVRTPGGAIEKKEFAISWHYRNCPGEFANFQARKLVTDLETGLSNRPVTVIHGKKIVEVKATEANKGVFANWFYNEYLEEDDSQFSMVAIGDDRTDEDMFLAIKGKGVSIKVGEGQTNANYRIDAQESVYGLLEDLNATYKD